MDNNDGRYILIGQTAVPCEDLMEWGAWIEEISNRRVRQTSSRTLCRFPPYFLGLDHRFWTSSLGQGPPILFRDDGSIVPMGQITPHVLGSFSESGKEFTEPDASFLDIQERCSTWLKETQAQHQAVVDFIKQPEHSVKKEIPENRPKVLKTPVQHETNESH